MGYYYYYYEKEKENNNLLRHTQNPHILIFTPCIRNIPLWKERKTVMKWEKQIVGIKRIVEIDLFFFFNWCGNRLEKEIKKKKKKKDL